MATLPTDLPTKLENTLSPILERLPRFHFLNIRTDILFPSLTMKNSHVKLPLFLIAGVRVVIDEKINLSILLDIKEPPRDPNVTSDLPRRDYPLMAQITLWKNEDTGEICLLGTVIMGLDCIRDKDDVDKTRYEVIDTKKYFVSTEEMERTVRERGGRTVPRERWNMYRCVEYELDSPGENTFKEYMDVINGIKLPEELGNGSLYGWLTDAIEALKSKGFISDKSVETREN